MSENRLSSPVNLFRIRKGGFFYTLSRTLSYIFPVTETVLRSEFSGLLEIGWSKGKRVVNNGQANYSFGNLHTIFQEALKVQKDTLQGLNRVLILGFGAGSIYSILRKKMKFSGAITGVDIDPLMLEIFRQLFSDEIDESLQLFAADAAAWETTEKYDLILIDLFIGLDHAPCLFNDVFIRKIKTSMQPEGKVIMNTIFGDDQSWQRTDMLSRWNRHFKQCSWLSLMNSNFILVCK